MSSITRVDPIRRSKVRLTTDFTGSGGNIGASWEQIPFHITDEDGLGIVGAGDGASSLLTTKVSGLYLIEVWAHFSENTVAAVYDRLYIRIGGSIVHEERAKTAVATSSMQVSGTITRGIPANTTIDAAALVQSDDTIDIIDAFLAVTRLGPAGVTGV